MTFDEQDVLRRFHRALVREIQASNPDHLTSPFTVAEIYQNLVPYRTHRDELGVEMNADYEHALLRLLAGEGDFLTIESRTARQEIREELESPNPNTGLFRDFAAADVRLNPERLEDVLSDEEFREAEITAARVDGEGEEPPDPSEDEADAATLIFGHPPDAPAGESEVLAEAEGSTDSDDAAVGDSPAEDLALEADMLQEENATDDDAQEGADGEDLVADEAPPFENCPWCRENLPQRPGVKFCPFCGSNVQLVPCPECGEELELNWRFCVACGTEVAS